MCGIAGYLAREGGRAERAWIQRMCETLEHRGPDGEGYYCDGEAALGHRRLSIIDLEGGAQPLGNEDGSLQVVFNGEIYNYRELRKELEGRGHQFATHSDTEVLVHLYEEAGERTPEHLNGMFAFALWDGRRRELFVARDRLGKKPLYYSFTIPGTRFCFGSELKALRTLPGFREEVNPRAVAGFLCHDYVCDPETIYREVWKLPPGERMTVARGGHRKDRYWRPVFTDGAGAGKEEEVAEQIREVAADSVRRRMIADVPLGAFLSGGVDSSAVVAFMSGQAPAAVRTFSIGFTSEAFNELEYARMVAGRYRTEHHEHVVTPSIQEMLPRVVHHYDEPFGDASAVPTLYLSRMTRQYVTVALCGDGADEVFGGYRRYCHAVLEERCRELFPGWFRRSVIGWAGKYYPKLDYLPQVFRAKTILSNISRELADAYFHSLAVFGEKELEPILAPELRRELGGYSPREQFRRRFEQYAHLPPLQQLQAVDLETYLPGDILVKADRASMAYSLETRSPWMDYRLVELACRLPMAYKVNGLTGKWIFKRALAPHLPERILWRPKMGFSPPVGEWLKTSLRTTVEELVLGREMERLVCREEARRLWRQHLAGVRNHGRKLWNLLMLACWQRRGRLGGLAGGVETRLAGTV